MEPETREVHIATAHAATLPKAGRWTHYKFIGLIFCSITIALLLVAVSMQLYASSGAAQLDLSRPGYQSVRDQIKPDKAFDGFPASGAVSEATLRDFEQMYDKRASDATAGDPFSSDVLSDETLGLDAPVAVQQ